MRPAGCIRPIRVSQAVRQRLALCLCFFLAAFCPRPARADLDSDMARAIDEGVDWLLEAMKEDLVFPGSDSGEGLLALETYALIVAGVDVKHPRIAKNLSRLAKNPLDHTYTVSCIVFALDAAINQIHGDLQFLKGKAIPDSPKVGAKHRKNLAKAVKALLRLKQKSAGRWHYGPDNRNWDNSNIQFAVLGLGAGANRKVPIDDEVWEQIALHFIETQAKDGPEVKERIELHPGGEDSDVKIIDADGEELDKKKKKKKDKKKKDKKKDKTKVRKEKEVEDFASEKAKIFCRGWGYTKSDGHGGYSLNMTNAGVSSLLLARENLQGKMDPEFEQKLNKSIRDGIGFLISNWYLHQAGSWEYYALYSLEKTGDLGHIKKFGSHDWFQEVATKIVEDQAKNGSWPGNSDDGDKAEVVRRRTAFALLILNRASSLLTARSRSERMVLTGPGAHSADRSKRDNRVYLQHLAREIHVPSLFRTLRLRSSPKLIKLVEATVDDYPLDKRGLLMPFLYKAYRNTNKGTIKTFVRNNMAKVTGVEYEKASRFMVWFRRWQDVERIGEKAKKAIRYLVKYYKNTPNSLVLRKRIIWALTHCRSRKAAPMFIADLEHEDPEVRQIAYDALQFVPFKSPRHPSTARPKKPSAPSSSRRFEHGLRLCRTEPELFMPTCYERGSAAPGLRCDDGFDPQRGKPRFALASSRCTGQTRRRALPGLRLHTLATVVMNNPS